MHIFYSDPIGARVRGALGATPSDRSFNE